MTLEVGSVVNFTLSLKFDSNFCVWKCSIYALSIPGRYMIVGNVIDEGLLQLVILVSYITSLQIYAKMKLYSAWMVLTVLVINLSHLTQGGDEGIDIL